MAYTDIAIIVIGSIGIIVGIVKGFFNSLISLCGWFVSLILAILLTTVVSNALMNLDFIREFVVGSGANGFSLSSWAVTWLPADLAALAANSSADAIAAAMGDNFFMKLISPFVTMLISSNGFASSSSTIGEGLSFVLANFMFAIIITLVLFIAIRIILSILRGIANKIKKVRAIDAIDRILGIGIGAAKSALFVGFVFAVMTFFVSQPWMATIVADIDKSMVGKPLFDFVQQIMTTYVMGENGFLTGLLKGVGL